MVNQLSLAEIAHRLSADTAELIAPPSDNHLIESAVLILLIRQDDRWNLLLTRRTQTVRDHKGQVAFPGGAYEVDDASLEMTALRETHEEIGLEPSCIQILGRLHPVSTISSYRITPFVGTCSWPQKLQPAVDEVERVFLIPLDWLAVRENWYTREFVLPETNVKRQAIMYQTYDGELLWGISATLVHHLLVRLIGPEAITKQLNSDSSHNTLI
jgi:8-oxo-dGTP pyrophosphatase MutT (NUDIX family)